MLLRAAEGWLHPPSGGLPAPPQGLPARAPRADGGRRGPEHGGVAPGHERLESEQRHQGLFLQ
eukprot:8735981-Lingulodinium_polyedra.AAC.1